MSITIFQNAHVFDGVNPYAEDALDVVVEGNRIKEVGARLACADARTIDVAGRTLMPGMIDAHVHVYVTDLNVGLLKEQRPTYYAHRAAQFLGHALKCGFTSVRDAGGADVGLAKAIEQGWLASPRLYYSGRIVTQTGGHGDMRNAAAPSVGCVCETYLEPLSVIADGVDQVRRAVREEFWRGASQTKLVVSGGVTSPADDVHRCQYSPPEIAVAVEEAQRHGKYVMAHCISAQAAQLCAELGVRSIEHATLMNEEVANVIVQRGAFVVPTLAIKEALVRHGESLGLPAASLAKLDEVGKEVMPSLEILVRAGVSLGFGTDLLGPTYIHQCIEFELRAELQSPIDVLRSATSINAQIMQREGELGCISPGALADLLVVDGDPLEDISLLSENGERLSVIMQNGDFVKNELSQ